MPTNPSSPESPTLETLRPSIETLLDELESAARGKNWYDADYRSSREAVTQRFAELEAQNGKLRRISGNAPLKPDEFDLIDDEQAQP